jgi:hypothetical protein
MPQAVSSGFQRRGSGGVVFTAEVDMGTLPTLPERLDDAFRKALIFHLADAAQRVIDTARHYLVRLSEPALKVGPYGKPIHGYDTGVMYISLHYELMEALLLGGVFYDLNADPHAPYWRFVEFGFTLANGQWWPGYHFLEAAIMENEGYIRGRVREAWADTAIALALEAKVPGGIGRLGFGPL